MRTRTMIGLGVGGAAVAILAGTDVTFAAPFATEIITSVAFSSPPSAGNPSTNDISVYERSGAPSSFGLAFRETVFPHTGGTIVDALAIGDADDNGVNEIYVATHASDNTNAQIVAYDYVRNSGTLTNARTLWINSDANTYRVLDLDVGDADNNGSQELYVARKSGAFHGVTVVDWAGGANPGVFGADIWGNSSGYIAYGVAVGKVRNDSTNRLVLATGFGPNTSNTTQIDVVTWDGVNPGTFNESVVAFPSGYQVQALAAGDTDDDGDIEVLIASGAGGSWQLNSRVYNGSSWVWDPTGDTPSNLTNGYYTRAVAIGNADNIPTIPEPGAIAVVAMAGLLLTRRRTA